MDFKGADNNKEAMCVGSLLSVLSKGFTSIFYVDLDNDTYYSVRNKVTWGDYPKEGSWNEFQRIYADGDLLPEDRDYYLKNSTSKHIREELEKDGIYFLSFRDRHIPGHISYYEMTAIKDVKNTEHCRAIISFHDITHVAEKLNETKRQEEYIKAVAEEYQYVAYARIDDDTLIPVRLDDKIIERNPEIASCRRFSGMYTFLEKNVIDTEREKARLLFEEKGLIKELDAEPHYVYEYRIAVPTGTSYYQMRFVRMARWEADHEFLFGIRDITSEVKERYSAIRERERQKSFMGGLVEDYSLVFHVSYDTGEQEVIYVKNSEVAERSQNFITGSYEEVLTKYVEEFVVPEDREDVIQSLKKEVVLNELKFKRTYYINFLANSEDGPIYAQIKVIKIGDWDENHEVLIGVNDVDDSTKRENEYKKMLEEARTMAEYA
ncbi:MAG: hypothetical protein K6B75_03045, partial [Lachnospiraceae bacterium]|nr:hypothetical protein [Lachnospiraceae bacterium]